MRPTNAAFAVLLLLSSGCTATGGSDAESDPEGALREAVAAVGDYDGVELVLSATGDAAALAEAPDEQQAAELLFDSRVMIRTAGESEEDARFELQVDLDGTDVLEVRLVPESRVFLRGDLEGFADAVDDPTLTEDLDELVASAQAFGLGEVAEVALSGGWIELTGVEQLREFAEGMGGPGAQEPGAQGPEPDDEELEEVQQRLVTAFERFVDEDVTVEYVGEEDAGERVRATADGAALQQLLSEVTAIGAEVGGVDPDVLGPVEQDLPADETFTLDVWLEGGELSQIGLDLAGFDDTGEVPDDTFLLIGVGAFDGAIDPPEDAEPFDLFGLISRALFGGVGGDGLGDVGDLGDVGNVEVPEGAPTPDELDLDDLDGTEVECVPQEEVDEFELGDLVDAGLLEVC